MVCIEREALIRPVWEQVDEPSLANQVLGSEQKHLRDAGASQTRVEECARIIHRKLSIRFIAAIEGHAAGPEPSCF
jgi:hypothetical protein